MDSIKQTSKRNSVATTRRLERTERHAYAIVAKAGIGRECVRHAFPPRYSGLTDAGGATIRPTRLPSGQPESKHAVGRPYFVEQMNNA